MIPPIPKRPSWTILLPILVALVVASFAGATVFTEWRSAAIDRHAMVIAAEAAPAIDHLSEARRDLVRLRGVLRDDVNASPHTSDAEGSLRRALDASIAEYELAVPAASEEAPLARRVLSAKSALLDATEAFHETIDAGDLAAARAILNGSLGNAANTLDDALEAAVELNVGRSEGAALEIRNVRSSSAHLALVLDALCAFVAFAAAAVLWNAIRGHASLLTRLRRISEERATELDAFAGRVAHDIRGPLGVVAFAFDVAGGAYPETARAAAISRGRRSADRMARLVDGLLGFARAGAESNVEAKADVSDAVADVLDQLEDAARNACIEISADVEPGLDVRCSPGVLASILSNLAANSVKYMHEDARAKRIAIRALSEDAMVRLEVEDTGPGIPAGYESRIFEPFTRATSVPREGIGLGLATVRRFSEGCGGSCGVRANAEGGATFWVLLPAAATAA